MATTFTDQQKEDSGENCETELPVREKDNGQEKDTKLKTERKILAKNYTKKSVENLKAEYDRVKIERDIYRKRLLQVVNEVDCDSPILIAQNIAVGDNQKLVQTNNMEAKHIIKMVDETMKSTQRKLQDSTNQLQALTSQLQEAKLLLNTIQHELGNVQKTDTDTLQRVTLIQGLLEIQSSPGRLLGLIDTVVTKLRDWVKGQYGSMCVNALEFADLPEETKPTMKYISVHHDIEMLLTQLQTSNDARQGVPNNDDLCARAITQWISVDDGNNGQKLRKILEEIQITDVKGKTITPEETPDVSLPDQDSVSAVSSDIESHTSTRSSVTDDFVLKADEVLEELRNEQRQMFDYLKENMEQLKTQVDPKRKSRIKHV